jgi:hypothetical protein
MSAFGHLGAQIGAIAEQQTDLQRAVASGELWMEAGVAETAAKRCDQAVQDINASLAASRQLAQTRRFGNNEDGLLAAKRYADAAQEYIAMMESARSVIEKMAATYRAAGRTVAEADAAGWRMFQGQFE